MCHPINGWQKMGLLHIDRSEDILLKLRFPKIWVKIFRYLDMKFKREGEFQ